MYQDALRTRLFWTVTVSSVIVSIFLNGYYFHYQAMWSDQGVRENLETLFVYITLANIISMIFAGWMFQILQFKARGMNGV